jgi:hypothetical protein
MSPAELKMQPTIHFQSGHFKYRIVSIMVLLVKIRRLNNVFEQ